MKQNSTKIVKTQNTENSIKRRYPELFALWTGLFIDILGFYIIIPYLPSLMEIYNTTPLVIGLLLATNAIFTLFSAPIWGRLSDKFGRRPMQFSVEIILLQKPSLLIVFLLKIVVFK